MSAEWTEGNDEVSFQLFNVAYPLIVHARSAEGEHLGYVPAFSNGMHG